MDQKAIAECKSSMIRKMDEMINWSAGDERYRGFRAMVFKQFIGGCVNTKPGRKQFGKFTVHHAIYMVNYFSSQIQVDDMIDMLVTVAREFTVQR